MQGEGVGGEEAAAVGEEEEEGDVGWLGGWRGLRRLVGLEDVWG